MEQISHRLIITAYFLERYKAPSLYYSNVPIPLSIKHISLRSAGLYTLQISINNTNTFVRTQ